MITRYLLFARQAKEPNRWADLGIGTYYTSTKGIKFGINKWRRDYSFDPNVKFQFRIMIVQFNIETGIGTVDLFQQITDAGFAGNNA